MVLFMEDFKFFNIIPYNPGREEQTAKDIIEFYQRTGIVISICDSCSTDSPSSDAKALVLSRKMSAVSLRFLAVTKVLSIPILAPISVV